MTQATEKQIELVRSLSERILAKPLDPKPTFKKSWNGRKVSSNENIELAQRIAREALGRIEANELTKDWASRYIDDLKTQAWRIGVGPMTAADRRDIDAIRSELR